MFWRLEGIGSKQRVAMWKGLAKATYTSYRDWELRFTGQKWLCSSKVGRGWG